MKKMYSLIALLLLSAIMLAAEAGNVTAKAALGCADLTNCCNFESCPGRGTVDGCKLTCANGTIITCPVKKKDGTCALSDEIEIGSDGDVGSDTEP